MTDTKLPDITLPLLERHLWKSADILRGSIDAADYKHYIFGLLFYKRLCDVWQEEYDQSLDEFGNKTLAAMPEEHRFHVPPGSHWHEIRQSSVDIGERLNVAFRAIEDASPRVKGVFADVDFANKERFPDALIEALMAHFEELGPLTNARVDANMLGDAYEYLIAQFADDAGKKGGEFYTPKQVVRLMVEILRPEPGMTIYDPACGAGGMLLVCWKYLVEQGQNPKSLSLYGQEKNLNTWAICKMSLLLHDIDDARVMRGDTLLDPKLLEADGSLKQFDMVLANPPFSLKNWGNKVWKEGDPFGRDVYGVPPKSYGDFAFIQHMVASLKPTGRMAVVVPHGVLFRGGAEGKIRTKLLQADLIEAVIGLGNNLFYGTGIPAAIVVINKQKAPQRREKVLIVNGEKHIAEDKTQNYLTDDHVARLATAVHDYEDQELLARVVELSEIADNDYNLNLSRYVQTDPPPPPIDVDAEVKKLRELTAKRDAAEAQMNAYLEELGYGE
ncbi:type I restriction endonuclease subunit M [Lujinxingia litoralis]|uniref:site-specific DNA-methyltransferase (adenine-specific) n=1 Tax=Lujinxingia litoralis TaxID=2211119 RepID=A0A328C4H9_9DELT|nr:class I SAM-dependent DNA methyltransferase [Lujinxingia litoralis]RAL20904.1 type I restriction endonuclease subunit M [Lujinxingia litoralis]